MTQVLAHRGYAKAFPENTMLAFKEAAKYPIAGFELDVHLTKDGVPVICHDEDIKRTSNGSGLIKDMTLAELRSYLFTNGMVREERTKEDLLIPKMEDFLAWLQKGSLIVNIELKTNIFPYPGIEKKLVDMVRGFSVEKRVIFSSFNHHSIQRIQDICDIPCGFLTDSGLLRPGAYCRERSVRFYHPNYRTLEDEDFEDLKAHGIGLNPYTVDDEEAMVFLKEKGANYIITNDVAKACRVLSSQDA